MTKKKLSGKKLVEDKLGIPMSFSPNKLNEEFRFIEDGEAYFDIALSATFFFENGRTLEARTKVADLFEAYHAEVGDNITIGVDPKTRRFRKLANSDIANIKSWLPKLGPHEDFNPAYTTVKTTDEPSAFSFHALSCLDYEPENLSYVSYSFPLLWASSCTKHFFKDFVIKSCNILQPAHGYGGLGIVLPLDDNTAYATGFASRFRGLEFGQIYSDTEALSVENKIRTINWLTVISEPWIKELGGKTTLKDALGEEIDMQDYECGCVIQAGPFPRFGDVNKNEPMVHYEKVAKTLKPIRIEELEPIDPFEDFDEEKTKAWLARFD